MYRSCLLYTSSLQATISDILDRSPDLEGTLFDASSMKEKESEDVKRCFIIITSDKGLAGSYNHNVFKLADEYIAGGKDNTICAIGYMSRNYYLNNPKVKIDDEFVYPAAEPTGYRARGMACLLYTSLRNRTAGQKPRWRLLPDRWRPEIFP